MSKMLPGNTSVWIYDIFSYEALSGLKINEQNITTLHYTLDFPTWMQTQMFQKLSFRNL